MTLRKRLLLAMILVLSATEGAAAQAAGNTAPRNVRDIFLALPFPDGGARALERVGPRLSTRAQREAALRDAVISLQNGWLNLSIPTKDGRMHPGVSLTCFNHASSKRLVVLQVIDHGLDEPASMDYAWELVGSTFTPVDILDYLPNLEYGDFWDGPRRNDLEKDFFLRMGAYVIVWPHLGTTAMFCLVEPWAYTGQPPDEEMAELFRRRQRTGVELRWDRRQGRFTKGEYIEAVEDDEDHDHHE